MLIAGFRVTVVSGAHVLATIIIGAASRRITVGEASSFGGFAVGEGEAATEGIMITACAGGTVSASATSIAPEDAAHGARPIIKFSSAVYQSIILAGGPVLDCGQVIHGVEGEPALSSRLLQLVLEVLLQAFLRFACFPPRPQLPPQPNLGWLFPELWP